MKVGTCGSRWVVAVAVGVWLAGCAAREISQPPPQPAHLEHEEYVIGVRDVLRISVWKNPELSVDVIVRMDGKISVPLLDDVQAEGLTPMELKEVLAREFSEYVASPDVTVILTRMDSQFVLLMGDGLKANRQVPLTQDLRVLDAIALGGGFSGFADRDDIRIVRRHQDGTEVEYRFDYDAYIKGKAPGTNIVLQNRDTVIVPD